MSSVVGSMRLLFENQEREIDKTIQHTQRHSCRPDVTSREKSRQRKNHFDDGHTRYRFVECRV
jgi:hypothetical protein